MAGSKDMSSSDMGHYGDKVCLQLARNTMLCVIATHPTTDGNADRRSETRNRKLEKINVYNIMRTCYIVIYILIKILCTCKKVKSHGPRNRGPASMLEVPGGLTPSLCSTSSLQMGGHSVYGGGGGGLPPSRGMHQPGGHPMTPTQGLRAQVPHQYLSGQVSTHTHTHISSTSLPDHDDLS